MKQLARKYLLNVEEKIKVEVGKLLKAGFIEEIKCLKWLANIVSVKKKGGQIRICVDFRDLNKAWPKDEFPLPNVGHFGRCSCWSWMLFLYGWLQWLHLDFHGTSKCSKDRLQDTFWELLL